jgi:hypothetical protein
MLIEDRDTAIQSADDESSLLTRIPKAFTRRQIDMSIERIFSKEMSLERGRQTLLSGNKINKNNNLSHKINILFWILYKCMYQ